MDDHENALTTWPDPARFVLQDHNTLHAYAGIMVAAQARRAEGRLPQERLEELRATTGLTCTAHGLLADRELQTRVRILDTVVFEWLHTLFQEGAVSIEIHEMYKACWRATAPDPHTAPVRIHSEMDSLTTSNAGSGPTTTRARTAIYPGTSTTIGARR